MTRRLPFVLLLSVVALSACRREAQTPATQAPAGTSTRAPATATTAPAPLKDVVETTPRYVIGITYPKEAAPYPGLVSALMAYTADARKDLVGSAEALGNDTPTAPYELSLSYTTLVDSPDVVAIAADGSLYTGGAHGSPLIARFVWLPKRNMMLTSDKLVPDAKGWQAISDFVREQLHTALSQRIDADDVPAEERADMLKNAGEMIDDGTQPKADAFAEFEPRVGADGKKAQDPRRRNRSCPAPTAPRTGSPRSTSGSPPTRSTRSPSAPPASGRAGSSRAARSRSTGSSPGPPNAASEPARRVGSGGRLHSGGSPPRR